jgi:hypothetical protein
MADGATLVPTIHLAAIGLHGAELLDANPMPLIGRPKVPKTLPKSYPARAVTDLVAAIEGDHGSTRATD